MKSYFEPIEGSKWEDTVLSFSSPEDKLQEDLFSSNFLLLSLWSSSSFRVLFNLFSHTTQHDHHAIQEYSSTLHDSGQEWTIYIIQEEESQTNIWVEIPLVFRCLAMSASTFLLFKVNGLYFLEFSVYYTRLQTRRLPQKV